MNPSEAIDQIVASTPSTETVTALRDSVAQAQAKLEIAEQEYRAAVVARARVFGWVSTAAEAGVSPKMLHSWAKAIPGVDISATYAQIRKAQGGDING